MIACIDGGLVCIPTLLVCAGGVFLGKKFLNVCKRSCKCNCHASNKAKDEVKFTNAPDDHYEDFHVGQTVNVRGESFTKGLVKRIVVGQYIRVEDFENVGSEETRAEEADVYPSQLSVNSDSIMH